MSGWVPMPAEVWPIVVATLPQPWPEEAALFDLRWHADQHGRIPSRKDLAERWGWTRDEVRTPLRHPERWWDPAKGPAPESREEARRVLTPRGPRDLTQADPARPSLTQAGPNGTSETGESVSPDPARPSLTQADPAVPQRASPPSPSPSPPHGTEQVRGLTPPAPAGVPVLVAPVEPSKPDPLAEHFAAAAALWGQQALPACGRKPSTGPGRSSKLGKALVAALRKDPDAVLDAIRFVIGSNHAKARYFRDNRYDIDTVLRHVESYAGLWRDLGAGPAQADKRPEWARVGGSSGRPSAMPDPEPEPDAEEPGGLPLDDVRAGLAEGWLLPVQLEAQAARDPATRALVAAHLLQNTTIARRTA